MTSGLDVGLLLPPVLFLLFTLVAYVKVAIVLQVLRRGLGAGIPPLGVTIFLGLSLSALTMSPVLQRSLAAASAQTDPQQRWQASLEPLSEYLTNHTRPQDRQQLQAFVQRAAPGQIAPKPDLSFQLSAFLLTELRSAFGLAVALLLPFLLLEVLAALLLSGLGLSSLSVRAVTLPFKLLLFLLCDGLGLLLRALLQRSP